MCRRRPGPARDAIPLPFVFHRPAQQVLALGVEHERQRDRVQRARQGRLARQQVARRRAQEHLDAGDGRVARDRRDLVDVVGAQAHVEQHVAAGDLAGAGDLRMEGLGGQRRRARVRHVGDGRDARGDRGGGARRQVLLVGQAGVAQVDVHVDRAGQQPQAGAVDLGAGGGVQPPGDVDDDAGGHGHVADAGAVVLEDAGRLEHQVVHRGLRRQPAPV